MESHRPAEVAPPPEAVAFVRFCYRRRRAGWPELYDEMCAVASRRLYNGWGFAELAEHGIGFSLFETPSLAVLAHEVAREDAERRRHVVVVDPVAAEVPRTPAVVEPVVTLAVADEATVIETDGRDRVDPVPTPILRLAGAPAG
jgi:hypothetical protein